MRPYQNVSLRTICVVSTLLIVGEIGSAAAQSPKTAIPASVSIKNDALTRSGFEHYYDADYDRATEDFEKVLAAHPDAPAAVNHLLSAVMFGELSRVGALDTSLYANNSFLDQKREFVLDAQVKQRIQDLETKALQLAEDRLKNDPSDIQALYARGVTRSMQSTYTGLVQKA